jgi:hypothetical protein
MWMRTDFELPSVVYAAFRAAFLLTGNMASAENAVLKAIELLDPTGVSAARFLPQTIQFSIPLANNVAQICNESTRVWLDLPVELLNILQLTPNLRCCFVLRILLGFSAKASASLLHLDVAKVNADTCVAMQQLASLSYFQTAAFVSASRAFASTSIM